MATRLRDYDVFLSYSAMDSAVADVVRQKFEAAGLPTFAPHVSAASGRNVGEQIRYALAESRVVVLLVTQSSIHSPNLLIEIGAAMMWQKPVYVLLQDTTARELPAFLQEFAAFPISKVDEVVRTVAHSIRRPANEELEALRRIYVELDIPTDRLAGDPALLERFAVAFNEETEVQFTPERVLQELLRLRKHGKLPEVRNKRRVSA